MRGWTKRRTRPSSGQQSEGRRVTPLGLEIGVRQLPLTAVAMLKMGM